MKMEYPTLRCIWIIMAMDLFLFIVRWLIPVADVLIVLIRDGSLSGGSGIDLYLMWIVQCLRLLNWLGMVILLAYLPEKFKQARAWYLFRILVFFLSLVIGGLADRLDQNIGMAFPVGKFTVSAVIELVVGPVLMPLVLSFCNRSVLKGAAAMLDYFGMEKSAQRNRRCGLVQGIFSGTFVVLILVSMGLLVGVNMMTGHGFFSYLEVASGTALLKLAFVGLLFLLFISGLGILVLWGISAGCMKRTYTEVKGLSR